MSEQSLTPEALEMRKRFVFSPSSLIDFERSNRCLYKWYKYWIERSFSRDDSEAQMQGRYFEYLCLGAPPWGDAVISLPLTSSGAKTVTQLRIERQAEKFRNYYNPNSPDFCGEIIVAKHVKASTSDPLKTKGIWDFVTEDVLTKRRSVVDLKLTQSIDSQYGYQPWGNVENIDPLQLGTYKRQYLELYDDEDVDTKYYVADHGPRLKTSLIQLNIAFEQLEQIEERYIRAYNTLKLAELVNFEQWLPSYKECGNCPVQACAARNEMFVDVYTD
jgi:hypothetical protein